LRLLTQPHMYAFVFCLFLVGLGRLVDFVFSRYDADHDGLLTFEEFLTWTDTSPIALGFFNKIREFASIHLGIKPSDAREERDIVKQFLKEKRTTSFSMPFIHTL
jgi:hypothetical protein